MAMDRRSLLKALAIAPIPLVLPEASMAQTPAAVRRAGARVMFIRAPLANGIIPHAGETSMELYHRHPHDPKEEIVQPEDIRLQTRLLMRNHKEILD